MTKPVPTLQLHCIFENIHTWANRVLRPCISHYIDQWLARHPLQSLSSPVFGGGNPGNQSTPTRQAKQGSQQGLQLDVIGGEASPYFFKDLFDDSHECSAAIHQTDLSQGEQNTPGSSPSPSIEDTMSYLEQIVDNYRSEDDTEYFPDSEDDSESDDSFEDDSESDDGSENNGDSDYGSEDNNESDYGSEEKSETNDGSYAGTNSDIDGNDQFQYISGRRLSDPFNDNEQNPTNSDSWEDYDGSTSCEPSETEDDHEALSTLQQDKDYQDQESMEGGNHNDDCSSPTPRPRTTWFLPTRLPTAPRLTSAASTIGGINGSHGPVDLNFESCKDIANALPTRLLQDVEINPSTPSKQISLVPGPPNRQWSHAGPSIHSCTWIKKTVRFRKGFILIRFPCFIASDSSTSPSCHTTKHAITEFSREPEATSVDSSEYLFFEQQDRENPVPLVKLPGAFRPISHEDFSPTFVYDRIHLRAIRPVGRKWRARKSNLGSP